MPGGPGSCNCATCDKRKVCPRQLRPTVRITLKCTQQCRHCCYASSPDHDEHMSVAIAADVAKFVGANGIRRLNVMGGEFFCNPDWQGVLELLCGSVESVRLVTNGDWAGKAELRRKVIDFLAAHDNTYLALSHDKWHTNRHVSTAERTCKDADIICIISTKEEGDSPPAPVGRHEFEMDSIYSMFGCWCGAPDRRYSFLVDENGMISKCPFGIWTYDRIGHYLEGGFRERFKQFHSAFHGTFISSCRSCVRSWGASKEEMLRIAME